MRRVERKNDREPEETERDRVRREPLPLARSILWKPLPDSYHLLASMMRAPEQQAQLFVTQRAFLQVERHLRSAPDLELGGFLAGHLCLCPRTGKRYSVVNTVLPFADVSDQPLGSRVTAEAHARVRARLDAHDLALIGWYRNGHGLGLQLLPDDIETHLHYFNEPWQTTMLVVPDPSKSKGAFFTYDPRVGRGYCIPFYELFDEHAAEANRLHRTCVAWTTYVASTPVQPLAAGEREIVETVVVPMRSKPERQAPEPIDEWWDAIKDPWVRLKDVAVSATRREDGPMPLVWEPPARGVGAQPPALEPPRTLPAPVEDRRPANGPGPNSHPVADGRAKEAPRSQLAAAAPARPEPTRPAPPYAGPARPSPRASVSAESVVRTAKEERPAPAKVEVPAVGAPLRPQPDARRTTPKPRAIPPATAAAMARAAAPPAVALPPDFHDEALRWQRRRRIGMAVAAASFLAVIVLSTVRSRPHTVAQAATSAGAIDEAPSAPVAEVTENGHTPLPLVSAVDSLSGALGYYRDIANDHRRGLVGCRVLDRAYAVVGRARARVDSSRSQVAGRLSDADSIRVSMLGAEYTHVAQTYRRSGCQS